MANQTSFTSVLDAPSNEIDRTVKQLPVGTYAAMVQGLPQIDKNTKTQNEYSEYTFKILEARDDVDVDDLDTYLTNKDGSKRALQEATVRTKFYHTEKAIGRLLTFLDHLDGITSRSDADAIEATPRQRMSEVAGKQCLIHIKHEPWQSGEGVSARVDSTAPVEE